MKGLAFPQNAVSDRETSYEYGTLHNNEGDISINPAPGVLAIDPALMDGGSGVVVHEVSWVLHPKSYFTLMHQNASRLANFMAIITFIDLFLHLGSTRSTTP